MPLPYRRPSSNAASSSWRFTSDLSPYWPASTNLKGLCDSFLSQQLATETMMAGKEIAVKKYVVKLSEDERNQLNEMIRKGKSSAQRLTKARILLKADISEA